jgi:hypothetical protein
VIGGKSSSSFIHERGEESRAKESLEFFFGKKFLRGKRRSKEAKQRKARRSKIEGF